MATATCALMLWASCLDVLPVSVQDLGSGELISFVAVYTPAWSFDHWQSDSVPTALCIQHLDLHPVSKGWGLFLSAAPTNK